jgi:DNA-directed RNA polymerase subunit RPC12/RpoP
MPAKNDPRDEELKPKLFLASDDDDDEEDQDDFEEDEEGVGGEREIAVSYACEDCDYRWEVYLEEEDDELEDTQYCPMCGSANTSQI